jgi:hypothetical protein
MKPYITIKPNMKRLKSFAWRLGNYLILLLILTGCTSQTLGVEEAVIIKELPEEEKVIIEKQLSPLTISEKEVITNLKENKKIDINLKEGKEKQKLTKEVVKDRIKKCKGITLKNVEGTQEQILQRILILLENNKCSE